LISHSALHHPLTRAVLTCLPPSDLFCGQTTGAKSINNPQRQKNMFSTVKALELKNGPGYR